MQNYTAYYHTQRPLDGAGIVVVKDGFCWFALLLPFLWAVWHRLWLAFIGFLLVSMAVKTVLDVTGATGPFLWFPEAALGLIFALAAQELRHMKLMRDGYRELGPICANGRDEAESRVLALLSRKMSENRNDPLAYEG
ncbi:DUF2628 domain-containing protein [Sneathiella chinensis]|uniref:DUF2628 domain-containing protein n=1 Tax=Sneathiella chinensis TaxID=349750 RepID=A0ABQ5U057_9PROT|nr:DUF2628 domain-containing protein [Sneathiella chinensis]GLQ05249.1 hypothetical protein GCM10007924_04700 [Sneathiella chinensis]